MLSKNNSNPAVCVNNLMQIARGEVPYQFELDAELDVLRALIDQAVAPEAKIISPGLHRDWSAELNEIGRLLGRWMNPGGATSKD